jgi:hypothetical protein
VGFHPMFTLSSVPSGTQLYFAAQVTTASGTATTPRSTTSSGTGRTSSRNAWDG